MSHALAACYGDAMNTLAGLTSSYLAALESGGYAANTIRTRARVARAFLALTGDKPLSAVTAEDVDLYFANRSAAGLSPATSNLERTALTKMFDWALDRRLLGAELPHPVRHRRRLRVQARPKRRLPASEFGRLLDAAEHPRDRAVLALGIYLLLRQSEIADLRVGDVDLTHGTVAVRVLKTGKHDLMPVSAELDRELRSWLSWYATQVGPLADHYRLVPAKGRPVGAVTDGPLKPTTPVAQPERIVHRALAAIGHETRDEDGNPIRDGIHTLRRSAARAMFDRLVEDGYDGAGRVVQSLLHHASFRQTEVYLGIDMDSIRRDELLRGRPMFTQQQGVAQRRLVAV